MKSGYLLIDKEKGMTSFAVVSALRKILHTKKIGHTGTLDPMATGLLLICVEKGTKAVSVMPDARKEYIAEMTLGLSTDTEDITGEVLERAEVNVTPEQIREVFPRFIGEFDQIPPMYSAKKVNGQKLYDLARRGEVIERKPSHIEIYELEILSIDLPKVTFRVLCSKGTYIRTLCKDIGDALGTLATMSELRRTKTENFDVSEAKTLENLREMSDDNIGDCILELDSIFSEYPSLRLKAEADCYLKNGNRLYASNFEEFCDGDIYRIYFSDGTFGALYEPCEDYLKPVKMFL
jgi:tRNA pseudouridine55 synthase